VKARYARSVVHFMALSIDRWMVGWFSGWVDVWTVVWVVGCMYVGKDG
jgi:hypothetical protein